MRIDIHAEGFQLTSQLRALTESRLLSELRSFREHIESVAVHLRTRIGGTQAETNRCDVVARLHPSGEVRARAENARMDVAIERAAEGIRAAVENDISRTPGTSIHSPVIGTESGHRALEIVLDDSRISHRDREMLERPENYLRPIVVREYWRSGGGVEHARSHEPFRLTSTSRNDIHSRGGR